MQNQLPFLVLSPMSTNFSYNACNCVCLPCTMVTSTWIQIGKTKFTWLTISDFPVGELSDLLLWSQTRLQVKARCAWQGKYLTIEEKKDKQGKEGSLLQFHLLEHTTYPSRAPATSHGQLAPIWIPSLECVGQWWCILNSEFSRGGGAMLLLQSWDSQIVLFQTTPSFWSQWFSVCSWLFRSTTRWGIFLTHFLLVDIWSRWKALTKAVTQLCINALGVLPRKRAEEGFENNCEVYAGSHTLNLGL